jgi:cell division topological specificity factor
MSILNYFRRTKSAGLAKDRLQIIIAQERGDTSNLDYLPLLRKEILAVVAKYTKVDADKVTVDLQSKDNNSILELNVTLPEAASTETTSSASAS